jgi:hypothetical protein
MSMAGQQAVDRFRQLERLHRAAQGGHEHAHRMWEEAREELAHARIGLERMTQGSRFGVVRPDEHGRAVRVVGRETRTPSQHGHMQVVGITYAEVTERVPAFDEATTRLHAATKAEVAAREEVNAAGRKAGRFRQVTEEAAVALGRTALPSQPAAIAADPAVPAMPRW